MSPYTQYLQTIDTTGSIVSQLSRYYTAAAGVVIVYDITKRQSFTHVEKWLREAREKENADLVIMLLGNMHDQRDIREVSIVEGRTYAGENIHSREVLYSC